MSYEQLRELSSLTGMAGTRCACCGYCVIYCGVHFAGVQSFLMDAWTKIKTEVLHKDELLRVCASKMQCLKVLPQAYINKNNDLLLKYVGFISQNLI